MNYTLHQLKIFLKVARLKSITNASKELYLTQPAVSIQLKKFQDQFEIPLTEVIGRQLYVTDFGAEVVGISEKILEEAEVLKSITSKYKGLVTGRINISIVSTAQYVMPYFLKGFMEKYPDVEINIDVTNKKKVLESLKENRTDFALISVLPDDMLLEKIELMKNYLFLIGSQLKDHKKFEFNNSLFLFREEGSATKKVMVDYLNKFEVTYRKKIELVSNEAVKQSILAGLGYSIMPIIGLKNELLNKSLKIISAPNLPIVTNWNLVYNKGKKLNPATLAFIEHINSSKDQIIEEYFSWQKNVLPIQ
jgi:DNA-binding transcriptional LysR family regulator